MCTRILKKSGQTSEELRESHSHLLDAEGEGEGREGAWRRSANSFHVLPFDRYVQPPMISFEAIFEQSTPNSPIVFILSPGSDPASDLMKLAERSGFGGTRLKFLAMGQGQEKVAGGFNVSWVQERAAPGGAKAWIKQCDTSDSLIVVSL